jgi:hypothetical protein
MPSGAVERFICTLFIVCLCRGMQAAAEGIFFLIFMISLSQKALKICGPNEYYLLACIVDYMNNNDANFPDNDYLSAMTGDTNNMIFRRRKKLLDMGALKMYWAINEETEKPEKRYTVDLDCIIMLNEN